MSQKTASVPEGYIVDYIDGKFRKDTPEEYVRQMVEKRLVNEHDYSRDQIKVEETIKIGDSKKRVDIAIYPENSGHAQEDIQIIIECKKESVDQANKQEGVGQLKSYMAACVNSVWGMWINGKTKFVFKKILKSGGWDFEEQNDIPSQGIDISQIDRPTRNFLKKASGDNLLFSFKTCHNHIYVNDGMQKQQAFFELLKVIFCKIMDERNIPKPLEFYASSSEKLSNDGQLTVKNRIDKIFEKVKNRYPNIFQTNDKINLSSVSLAYTISELQKYSLSNSNIDVKGKAYEEIVGSNLRGDRGEFFTPRNVARMAVKMLDIPSDAKILDPACGTGGFLILGMNKVITNLTNDFESSFGKEKNEWDGDQTITFMNRVKEIAAGNFFGFDINPDLVKASKMNMVMNNDGAGNILQNNSLSHPHSWKKEIKDKLCDSFNLPKDSIRKKEDLALFDFVVTNPPFGTKLPIKSPDVLEQYDLGHIWKKTDDDSIVKTDRLVTSRAPEVLFIERCYDFLKPNGVMGIVLPDAILGAPGIDYTSIREWIIQKCRIIASIDLHADTFQPGTGTQTSVLFLQKKSTEQITAESKSSRMENHEIFFGIVDHVGHDKRGVPIYKRDEDGNEILLEYVEDGSKIKKTILNDQTDEIADVFLKWKKNLDLN